jgi:hypothetical protein
MITILQIAVFLIISDFQTNNNKEALQDCNIVISILGEDLVFKKDDTKSVNVLLTNKSSRQIKVPEWFYIGAIDDEDSEIIFEIEKLNETKNKFESVNSELNDYDYLLYGRGYKIIDSYRKHLFSNLNIEIVRRLSIKGKYRIRVTLRLKNICNHKEIKSGWKLFKITS